MIGARVSVRLIRRIAIVGFAISLLPLVGCGGGESFNNVFNSGSLVRAATGGTVTSGGLTLVFPAGALTADTSITAAATITGLPVTTPGKSKLVPGTTYALGPDGSTFSKPVSLSIAYDAAKLPAGTDESTVSIYSVVGGAWIPAPGSVVDKVKHTVSASITHFSTWGALATPTATPTVLSANVLHPSNLVGADAYGSDVLLGYLPTAAIHYKFVDTDGIPHPGFMHGSLSDDSRPTEAIQFSITSSSIGAGSRFPVSPPELDAVNGAFHEPTLGSAWLTYYEPDVHKLYYGISGYIVIDDINLSKHQAIFHFEALTVEGSQSLNLLHQEKFGVFQGVGTLSLDLNAVCYSDAFGTP